jgi:hypothetical protein
MIIATFNAAEGSLFNEYTFVQGLLDAGTINRKQMSPLRSSLHGHQPLTLHIEKIGQKLWVTVLSPRKAVWTWAIGPRGKRYSPDIDTSEANMGLVEAMNTRA